MGDRARSEDQPSRLHDMRVEQSGPPRFDWRFFLAGWAINFALPRYAYWTRWPSRLKGKRLSAYLAFKFGQGMAMRYWVVPGVKRMFRAHEQTRDQLRSKLGREPTSEELLDYLEER